MATGFSSGFDAGFGETTVDQWYARQNEPVRVAPYSLAALLANGAFQANPDDLVVEVESLIVGAVFSGSPGRAGW